MNPSTSQSEALAKTGPSIQVASGHLFYFDDSSLDDIRIEDIAHALSNICRFTGHTKSFYSVAQHSVLVSQHVPDEHKLAALLHDAPEAYINDMSRPIKYMRGLEGYRHVEASVWNRISLKFGVPYYAHECIKEADDRMLFTEKRDLLPPLEWDWHCEPYADEIVPQTPEEAKRKFLVMYYGLIEHGLH